MITRETSQQFTGFKVFEYQLGQLLFDNQWISYYFDAGTGKILDNSNEIDFLLRLALGSLRQGLLEARMLQIF